MKRIAFLLVSFVCLLAISAKDDPTVMTVNGVPVSRSEFEYSYNKNNSEGVIDKKSVSEYVDLFVNYKLKVAAALDAHMDTMSSFKKEFATYRDQQIRPSFVSDEDLQREALSVYNDTKKRIGEKGLVRPAHIFIHLGQKASDAEQKSAKSKIDSLYSILKKGAVFEEVAKKYSQDNSASQGGSLPWIGPGQTLKEFEDQAYSLKKGEMSKPFLSAAGYHIILMKDKKQLEPFDSLKSDILKFIEQRGVREKIIDEKLDTLVKRSNNTLSKEQIVEQKAAEMEQHDSDLKNLIREYHDGLLLYEISNRTVWDKAAKDEEGLSKFYKKNKKKYTWDSPRFKGIVYHVKNEADKEAVRKCLKGVPFTEWADKLRKAFNSDSIIRIRVEKGIFKKGDDAFVDKMIFGKDTLTKELKDYPIDATYGKLLKKRPESYEDVRGLVTADYQDAMEKQWVSELRKKYPVVIYDDVIKTVKTQTR